MVAQEQQVQDQSPPGDTLVEVRDLKMYFPVKEGIIWQKKVADIKAVDGVSFQLQPGELLTVFGPNGAGKTTLIEMLEGLQIPDDGDTNIFGHNVRMDSRATKQIIGAQLQASSYFDYLKLTELLELFGGIYARACPLVIS